MAKPPISYSMEISSLRTKLRHAHQSSRQLVVVVARGEIRASSMAWLLV